MQQVKKSECSLNPGLIVELPAPHRRLFTYIWNLLASLFCWRNESLKNKNIVIISPPPRPPLQTSFLNQAANEQDSRTTQELNTKVIDIDFLPPLSTTIGSGNLSVVINFSTEKAKEVSAPLSLKNEDSDEEEEPIWYDCLPPKDEDVAEHADEWYDPCSTIEEIQERFPSQENSFTVYEKQISQQPQQTVVLPPALPKKREEKVGIEKFTSLLNTILNNQEEVDFFAVSCQEFQINNISHQFNQEEECHKINLEWASFKEEIYFYPITKAIVFSGTHLFRSFLEKRLAQTMDKALSRCIATQLIPRECQGVSMVKKPQTEGQYELKFFLESSIKKEFNGVVKVKTFSTSFAFEALYEKVISATLFLSPNSVEFRLDNGFCLKRTQETPGFFNLIPGTIITLLSLSKNPHLQPFLEPVKKWQGSNYAGDLSILFPSLGFKADNSEDNLIDFSCTAEITANGQTTAIDRQENLYAPAERISTFFEHL